MAKFSGDGTVHTRESSSHRDFQLDVLSSPKDSATMQKLMEEVQFNPKMCDEIRNYIKEHNLDIPSIESLDLKNPEHLKLLDQLYNPKVLKSILKKTHHRDEYAKEDTCHSSYKGESSSNTHSKTSSGSHSHRRSHERCCKRSSCSHSHHRSSHKYHDYIGREKHHRDHSKLSNPQPNFLNSPLLPKEAAYRYPSPSNQHHVSKKSDDFVDYHHQSHTDMMQREDDFFGKENPALSYNPDSYLFGSPMPLKKVKHESDRSPLGFVKRGDSGNMEGKSKGSEDRLQMGWMNHPSQENHDPNLANNSSLSAKKKGGNLFFNSASKDHFNVSGLFFSPKPNKYESPSR